MKKLLVCLAIAALLQGVSLQAQEVYNPTGLLWDPNSEQDLAGYKLYQKSADGIYAELGVCLKGITQFNFTSATPHPDGAYCWVATAYDEAGNESAYSNEVCAAFDSGAPAPPTGCVTIP